MTFPGDSLRDVAPSYRAIPKGTVLWRIHAAGGDYPMPWNGLRTFGPISSARWDPHPEPAANYAPLGVAYLGIDVLTCLAEVFQGGRFIDVHLGNPYITAFQLDQELKLLDLTDIWFLRIGGTAAEVLGPKAETRAWARALHREFPEASGLVSASAVVPGHEVIVLWEDRFPQATSFASSLDNPAIALDVAALADSIGYRSNVA
ncbi:RES family NAD+ phosphorylase [Glutamicibacter arilaitensis]|uniref:RES domain-containing protein n=1 Tax=Glutamicibacter arilaitensis TaxID=256701 RepID=A0A4Y8TXG5_9MICC|nr:RES family NAD+ phosphorylase [Glutamicibacter arilaitensis]TFH55753.1 RES domain-containing protein [Glutamicibacter arilaitensis]